jgi:hypothetical protein
VAGLNNISYGGDLSQQAICMPNVD